MEVYILVVYYKYITTHYPLTVTVYNIYIYSRHYVFIQLYVVNYILITQNS